MTRFIACTWLLLTVAHALQETSRPLTRKQYHSGTSLKAANSTYLIEATRIDGSKEHTIDENQAIQSGGATEFFIKADGFIQRSYEALSQMATPRTSPAHDVQADVPSNLAESQARRSSGSVTINPTSECDGGADTLKITLPKAVDWTTKTCVYVKTVLTGTGNSSGGSGYLMSMTCSDGAAKVSLYDANKDSNNNYVCKTIYRTVAISKGEAGNALEGCANGKMTERPADANPTEEDRWTAIKDLDSDSVLPECLDQGLPGWLIVIIVLGSCLVVALCCLGFWWYQNRDTSPSPSARAPHPGQAAQQSNWGWWGSQGQAQQQQPLTGQQQQYAAAQQQQYAAAQQQQYAAAQQQQYAYYQQQQAQAAAQQQQAPH